MAETSVHTHTAVARLPGVSYTFLYLTSDAAPDREWPVIRRLAKKLFPKANGGENTVTPELKLCVYRNEL